MTNAAAAQAPYGPRNDSARGETVLVAALLLLSIALRATLAGLQPLLESEAYYWLWGQHLAVGYVDHPPGVAVLLRLSSELAGTTVLGVRAASVVLGTLTVFLFHRWCRGLLGPRLALRALLVFVLAPFAFPFGYHAVPDVPLHVLWVACLVVYTGVRERDDWGRWLLLGVLTGLCIVSKYNGFLLPGVYAADLALTADGRRRLASLRPWTGLALAGLIAAPNLLWNASHGAATLATPLRSGLELDDAVVHVLEFLATPLGALTPLLAIAWVWRCVAGLRAGQLRSDPTFRLLFCASVVTLLPFVGVAILTHVHIHWSATAYIAAVPLLLLPGPGPSERFVRWGIGTAVGVVGLILLLPAAALFLPFGERHPDLARMRAEVWSQAPVIERIRDEVAVRDDGQLFLMSRDYHLTSLMAWMVADRIPSLPLMRDHFRQYEVWYDDGDLEGWSALVLDKDDDGDGDTAAVAKKVRKLLRAFDAVDVLEPIEIVVDGSTVRTWRLYHAQGFQRPLTARNRGAASTDIAAPSGG